MRLVIQRVTSAEVSVDGNIVGKITDGLFILVGVAQNDATEDAEFLAEKVSKMRIMPDDDKKMNLSIIDTNASVLAVSQFTLHAGTKKGNRPSFIKAAEPKIAEKIYNHFIKNLKVKGIKVKTGKFGEYMKINTNLDGPVTILLDSKSP